jgi:hypothetical protein
MKTALRFRLGTLSRALPAEATLLRSKVGLDAFGSIIISRREKHFDRPRRVASNDCFCSTIPKRLPTLLQNWLFKGLSSCTLYDHHEYLYHYGANGNVFTIITKVIRV